MFYSKFVRLYSSKGKHSVIARVALARRGVIARLCVSKGEAIHILVLKKLDSIFLESKLGNKK